MSCLNIKHPKIQQQLKVDYNYSYIWQYSTGVFPVCKVISTAMKYK